MLRWGALPPRHADQYDWISVYLHDRDEQGIWRTLIFTATLALASSTALMIKSPQGPDGPVAVTICVVAAALAFAAAVPFLLHWPTRRQSLVFSFTSTATIAAAALSYSNDYVGLMGCATFAVIGGFVAYFHTVHEVIANGAVAVVCALILAVRMVMSTGDIYLMAAALAIVATLNVGLPFGVLSLAQTLRSDLRSSGRDPLTGLHNRRSFHQSAYELIMRNDTEGSRLMVIVIDLDSFKKLNDTAGHAAGDAALIRISAALADHSGISAIIGRSGGEEFVIADVDHPDPPEMVAERLRQAIAELPVPVTASIGTACAPLKNGSQVNLRLLDELVEAADAAMYAAKRAGGNQVRHAAS
ncbi:GGDEF domain-containing protein [Mycolicibacterium rhodesiae]|uniref:GGDEF domain-containing protein n=1 Tax=Mycolicibacterium rhodesiae TaxID=36814 RepID=A0A1X0J429_MYCRH|nr:GGDEF domain-containing protein [Mycolicibacterium rhodesiae]MCV7344506.1 GGDEF domain-containing protein [Mycolicibacterium rhodesiae]ORB55995.1 GGDEF domain-containing protein [Mycolicibacterium rhodesiae]